jgi:hypothetical protein
VFVDAGKEVDSFNLNVIRFELQDFIRNPINSEAFIEILDQSGQILPYCKTSDAAKSGLPEIEPRDGLALYDGLYRALLWASYMRGPKTFTAIISSKGNGAGRPLSDIAKLSKEVGIPVNIIWLDSADSVSLDMLANDTGGQISFLTSGASSCLQKYLKLWEKASAVSFRVDESWIGAPLSLVYEYDGIFSEKAFSVEGIAARNVKASSVRKPEGYTFYDEVNAVDQYGDTAWAEGVDGNGEGEWIRLQFNHMEKISAIVAQSGYWKDWQTLENNNRIKTLEVEFADGKEYISLPDPILDYASLYYSKGYLVNFDKTHYSDYVTITISEVYPGRQNEDTCLSYIGFYR